MLVEAKEPVVKMMIIADHLNLVTGSVLKARTQG
jgi:hypothetical protein